MRVLLVNKLYPPAIGGIEEHVRVLARTLVRGRRGRDGCGGHEGVPAGRVEVAVLVVNEGCRTVTERVEGVEVIRAGGMGRLYSMPVSLSFPMALKRAAAAADLVHLHLPFPLGTVAWRAARPRIPLVVTYHSDIVRQRGMRWMYHPHLRRFLARAQAIITTSPALRDRSPLLAPFRERCHVVPLGIDLDALTPRPGDEERVRVIRERYGSPLILFVGRLIYYKGLPYLVRAAREMHGRVLVIGDGPLGPFLRQQVRRLGLDEKVSFMPAVPFSELRCFYHACDVFVLPSVESSEAFGLVQVEAQACGKPVVSTDLPTGVPFVNLDGVTGLVVPPRDPGALAAAVNRLLDDPALAREMGRRGQERARSLFSAERMAGEILAVYRRVLADGR